jgi:hypothetical protein
MLKKTVKKVYLRDKQANGRRYRQGRDLADKTTRRRIRRWGRFPESAAERPHLSGATYQPGKAGLFSIGNRAA